MSEISIVGAGAVGVAIAASLLHGRLTSHLVLCDLDDAKAEGEALDFAHASPLLGGPTVEARPLRRLGRSRVCIVTAGVKQRAGETRLELLTRNVAALSQIAATLEANGLPEVVVLVTNPVDVLTEMLRRRWAKAPVAVLGTGTVLDTMRLRHHLARSLDVSADSVHGWVLGEHGDSSVVLLDSTRVGGVPLATFLARRGRSLEAERATLEAAVRGAAYTIIERKGATSHGIGAVTARIVRAITADERVVLPVSAPAADGISAGVPCVVGARGAEPMGAPEMSPREASAFEASLVALQKACGALPT